MEQNKTGKYLKYAIGDFFLMSIDKFILCPIRDKLWVARINTKSKPRAYRYEI